MDQKCKEVREWLSQVLGEQPMPLFEDNVHTVELLHSLMQQNREHDRCNALLLEDYKQKSLEYQLEAERLQQLLMDAVGVSPSALSSSSTSSLQAIVQSAMVLELNSTSESSLMQAISELKAEAEEVRVEKEAEERLVKRLASKAAAAFTQQEQLKLDLARVEQDAEVENAKKQRYLQLTDFLQRKSVDYRVQLKSAQVKLAASGVDPSLYHQSLVTKGEELTKLKKKVSTLKAELNVYKDLPPNVSLARIKIEEAKRELAALDKELEEDFQNF
uniref:HAUS augmin-like complex subunit 1 isoform X2 n=1 Tax=Petromyzon marinus TaxID=7757 RepID=A0AAJ7WT44_PETMA|nr:HAUS augmin-like complex subunit 1 isoform X2 [Petromyzon marinus]